ncbi:thioesterase family protein [Schaalia sp. 19OD2882]|uniref:acyl-CoA thioesterase n=1 Tax=Schaalia sp. 19OD2882 TaxID=2794089 RepID=UPI001C1EA8F4|nr:acyl-CoA thioesterase domain-containing protein [Schaalia sp. 19OD2882]QWW20416.1 thioesterase family protein [Schaalia sp. 19OD2882]
MTAPVDIPLLTAEPVASVLRILQLEEAGDDLFHAHCLPQVRRVYGGQVIAQAALAACATLEDPERMMHSLHAYFLRGGDPAATFEISVERLRDGRSFSSRAVSAVQDGREILTMTASFQGAEDGLVFETDAPTAPAPEELTSALEIFRMMEHPVGRFLGKTAAFDLRHVGASLYTGADPAPSPVQHLWMRPRVPLPKGASQNVHRALLAYVIDQVMLEPAMRVLGLSWMTPGLSAASLDHAMWFHRDVDVSQWLLVEGTCHNVNSARTLTRARVFTRSGELVAEAEQQGMVRVPDEHHQGSQRWGFGVDPVTGRPALGTA